MIIKNIHEIEIVAWRNLIKSFAPQILILLCHHTSSWAGGEAAVQTDITMAKITTLLKAEKYAEALPYFDQLEESKTSLPESFYYYQIDALYESKDIDKTLNKASTYLEKFGKKGRHYDDVVRILAEFEIIADKARADREAAAKQKSIEMAQARKNYELKLEKYNRNLESCLNGFDSYLQHMDTISRKAAADCENRPGCYPGTDKNFVSLRHAYADALMAGADKYCNNKYTEPKEP